MVRLTVVDMNPVELKYYPFMTRLNKCTASCNVFSPKIRVPKETKDIYIKAFNIITKKDEGKAMTEHIHVIVNANSIVQYEIQNKNGIIKHVNMNVKIIISANKIIVGILAHLFVNWTFGYTDSYRS